MNKDIVFVDRADRGTPTHLAWAMVIVAMAVGTNTTTIAAQQTGAESVVLALDEVVGSVESIVLGEFRPGVDALRTNLNTASARARRACARAEGRTDSVAGLECDEAIAEAFAGTGEDLEHLVSLREPVIGATDSLIDTIGDALIAADEQSVRLERAGEERHAEIAQAVAALTEISAQFSDHITADRPLPIEVEVQVRELEQQRLLGEMRRSVHEENGANVHEVRETLATFKQYAQVLRAEYTLIFSQAEGQLVLIGDVSELLATRAEAAGFIRQVSSLAQELGGISAGLDAVAGDVTSFVTDAVRSTAPIAGDVPALHSRSGLEILRNIVTGGGSRNARTR